MGRTPLTALAILFLPIVACTSGEDMTLLHREITDVQRQVEQLNQSMPDKQDLNAVEARIQDFTAQTTRSSADLAMRVEQLQEQIEALHASLDVTTRQLQSISQELAAARGTSGNRATLPPVVVADPASSYGGNPSGTGGSPAGAAGVGAAAGAAVASGASTPDDVYRTAYEDYMRGNYDLAAQGFREYMKRWPDTELSDNALYWVGECLDAEDKTEEALEIFTQVLEEYPASDKAAAAQLKKGLLYLKIGDKGQGVLNLQYVVYEYPGTQEADLARERLKSLGMTIR
jgi:tol-pal system protein YbgF